MKKGFVNNIEALTLANDSFREVVYTAAHSQLVLMALKPKEEIGMEVHPDNDQFFRFEKGMVVPAGSQHNIINVSDDEDLKLYTIYSPAHHKDGTIHATKADAMASDEEFDGKTTE